MAAALNVRVQREDFDPGDLQDRLLGAGHREGAVVTFTGYVRAHNDQRQVSSLELEHYPGMTEKSIGDVLEEAAGRWPIASAGVLHRVGALVPGDRIVWVGVSGAHRGAAFSACEFIMDYLKTRAPFWKREAGPDGQRWVEARDADRVRARRWDGSADG